MKIWVLVLFLVSAGSVALGETADEMYNQWFQRGLRRFQQGFLKDAKVCFTSALSYKPGDTNALLAIEMMEERLARQTNSTAYSVAEMQSAGTQYGSVSKKTESTGDFQIRISLGNAIGIDREKSNYWVEIPISDEGGLQFEIFAVDRFWFQKNPDIGTVLGLGLFFAGHDGKYEGDGPDIELSTFGVIVEGGFAAKLGNHVVLEALPYVGFGGGSVEITGYSDGDASYIMYGAKGGVHTFLGNQVEVGIEIGYGCFFSEFQLQVGANKGDITYTGKGTRASAVVSYKF